MDCQLGGALRIRAKQLAAPELSEGSPTQPWEKVTSVWGSWICRRRHQLHNQNSLETGFDEGISSIMFPREKFDGWQVPTCTHVRGIW